MKGRPIPPEALVPAPVERITLRQQGEGILLEWEGVSRERSGRPLESPPGYRIRRISRMPGETVCTRCDDLWREVATVPPAAPTRLLDTPLPPGTSHRYRIATVDAKGVEGTPTDTPPFTVAPPLPPPRLELRPEGGGVRITIHSPGPHPVRHLVVRRDERGGERLLTPQPLAETTLFDDTVIPGRRYGYRARAVTEIDGRPVESSFSEEASLDFRFP